MRIRDLLRRLEPLLPSDGSELDGDARAFTWRLGPLGGTLAPVRDIEPADPADLHGVGPMLEAVRRNTAAFVAGRPANHVLLTGPRGCGKSTLARAVLGEFLGKDLRVISTDPEGLSALGDILRLVQGRPERHIVFCDDLSFDRHRQAFRSLKVALEGGLTTAARHLLVYATSNRRHLVAERLGENLEARADAAGEIHPGETTEEKIALSDRFGLWVPMFAPDEEEYVAIARHWLRRLRVPWSGALRQEAVRWAMEKGTRNGRTAYQFAVEKAQQRKGRPPRPRG